MFRERDGSVYPEMCDVLRWAGGGCHSPPNPLPRIIWLPRGSEQAEQLPTRAAVTCALPEQAHLPRLVIVTCLVVVELRVTSPQTPPFSMTRRDCFSLPPAPGLR